MFETTANPFEGRSRASLRRAAAAAMIAAVTVLAGPVASQAAEPSLPPIYDFLVMNVCLDDKGAITAESPLSCPLERQRDLRPGDRLPYFHTEPPAPAAKGCRRVGASRKYGFPLARSGTDGQGNDYPFVVGWTDYPNRPGCDFGSFGKRDVATLLAVGPDYASIVGYRKPDKWLILLGKQYRDAGAGVARFTGTWSFPANPPAKDAFAFATFERKQQQSEKPTFDFEAIAADRRGRLARTIQFWKRQDFRYGPPGAETKPLDTVLQFGFARSNEAGDAPGPSKGSEHLYMTRELGYVTRWENWARDDVSDRKGNVVDRAKTAYGLRNCGLPAGIEGQVSPNLRMGPITEDKERGLYSQAITTIANGKEETHTWYMVGCHDYSHVEITEPHDPAAMVDEATYGADYLANFKPR